MPPQTVYELRVMSDAARMWVKKNVVYEYWQVLGDGIILEHGHIAEIAAAMAAAGLEAGLDFVVER